MACEVSRPKGKHGPCPLGVYHFERGSEAHTETLQYKAEYTRSEARVEKETINNF